MNLHSGISASDDSSPNARVPSHDGGVWAYACLFASPATAGFIFAILSVVAVVTWAILVAGVVAVTAATFLVRRSHDRLPWDTRGLLESIASGVIYGGSLFVMSQLSALYALIAAATVTAVLLAESGWLLADGAPNRIRQAIVTGLAVYLIPPALVLFAIDAL